MVVSPSGVIYYLNLIGDCKLKEHNTSLLDFDIICRSDKCNTDSHSESLYTVDSVKCCSVSGHFIENKCSQMSVEPSICLVVLGFVLVVLFKGHRCHRILKESKID